MLHDVYYIIKPGILQQPVKAGADAVIMLEINIDDKENNIPGFELAEKYLADTSFCLLVQLHKPLTSGQATDLIAFLFFSNYHKPGGSPQIIVGGENMTIIKSGIEQLHKTAGEQGFSTIQITLASALPITLASTGQPAIRETYRGWLKAPNTSTDILFVNVTLPADISATHEALEAEEILFSQQNPGLFSLKLQNRQLHKQVQQLELLCKAAQQEISNQVSHNQILRSSSQATALQNYYNNEYEVLPLWFKRLGHVVKALMGKRSFKSLYSNKVKKYKD
jgi:hypothetical protein